MELGPRPDSIRQPEWQALPGFDRQSKFRVLRTLIRQLVSGRQPVFPVEGHGLGAPLFLEFECAFTWRGPAEVEDADAFGKRGLERVPVQKMIRTQRIEVANR